MSYLKFLAFSVVGAILWVGTCVTAGVLLGSQEVVKKNFELVILAIVFISVVPVIIEVIKHRKEQKLHQEAEGHKVAGAGQPVGE